MFDSLVVGGPAWTRNDRFDIVQTRVEEYYAANWHYRWTMRYMHALRGAQNIFPIAVDGSQTGLWTVWLAGSMVRDYGCPWTDYHVHDYAYIDHAFPKALPGWLEDRNPPYPNGIPKAPAAKQWLTHDWTRYFEWAEAYP